MEMLNEPVERLSPVTDQDWPDAWHTSFLSGLTTHTHTGVKTGGIMARLRATEPPHVTHTIFSRPL